MSIYHCRLCNLKWIELPPGAIQIAKGSAGNGVPYKFPNGDIHFITRIKKQEIQDEKQV